MAITTDLDGLSRQIRATRRRLDQRQGEARQVALAGKRITEEVVSLRRDIDLYEKAAAELTKISDERQSSAQAQIESLVTQGLRTVFDEDLSFHLVSGVRAKVPFVDFVVRSVYEDKRVVETSVMEARGAGLSSVVGFLLRLVIMLLSLDKQESILFLDETFAHVSEDYGPRLAEFLREIVDKTGVQIILVTHTHVGEMLEIADKRYKFELGKDGHTKVIEM